MNGKRVKATPFRDEPLENQEVTEWDELADQILEIMKVTTKFDASNLIQINQSDSEADLGGSWGQLTPSLLCNWSGTPFWKSSTPFL